jgi:hypothetical protein
MSSSGNLYDNSMTSSILKMANEYKDSIAGFICQNRFDKDDAFLYVGRNILKIVYSRSFIIFKI